MDIHSSHTEVKCSPSTDTVELILLRILSVRKNIGNIYKLYFEIYFNALPLFLISTRVFIINLCDRHKGYKHNSA